MNFLERATALVEKGFSVIPLAPRGPEARVILSYPFVLEVKKLSSALGRAEFAQLRRYMQITGAAAGCLINFPNYKDVVEIETALPGQKFSRVTERA
jgi:PD-(D/E)XK nuclease superfamily